METSARYFAHAQTKIQEVLDHELPNIQKAAEFVTESCKKGGRFYVFGSGHSHMIAEELYLRAGGLALVHGILPSELMLHGLTNKSTYLERLEGYAQALVELHRVDEKDTIMVISNSGRNAVPVDMCLAAKAKGAKVIAMTSMKHSTDCTSRHSSGKKMYEIADVTIDNCAEKGDASFTVEGLAGRSFEGRIEGISPTSASGSRNAPVSIVVENPDGSVSWADGWNASNYREKLEEAKKTNPLQASYDLFDGFEDYLKREKKKQAGGANNGQYKYNSVY